ncbi:ABC transporter ATP-binding protein [Dactylosporangium sp. CA-152071]|uniref:ABC transporter ATP-binding protein n=1 Tax=Dactylosporangium sp. CA-152071 TaxID=3239933 RepID=UPI003D93AB70
MTYRRGARLVHAARDVSIDIPRGRIVGLIGESGAGKSTVLRALLGLTKPTSGVVEIAGTDLSTVSAKAALALRNRIQVVMQNPYASLDPRWSVADSIAEPLRARSRQRGSEPMSKDDIARRVGEMLDRVRLPTSKLHSLPRELSGGERQRVAIARALSVRPAILVADEPVTALDNVTTAEILGLLEELHAEVGLAILIVSHSMSVIAQLADDVHVMQDGRVVESGSAESVLDDPQHPHTAMLIAASRYLDEWDGSGPELTTAAAR